MSLRKLMVLSSLFGLAYSVQAAEPVAMSERVEQLARPLIESEVVVGLSIAVVYDGKAEFLGLGHVTKALSDKPTPDTVYEIGSVTKVFTALLLADMAKEGLVALDQPVRELLPDDVRMAEATGMPITLTDLATHTSGLPRLPSNLEPADPTNPYADYDEKRLYAYLKDQPLTRKASEKVDYSNLGAGLLGHVLALKAATSFEQLVLDRICRPLSMNDTRRVLDNHPLRGRLAPGHDADCRPAANWDLTALAGAGGLRSTARDMARFVSANLEPGSTSLAAALAQTHLPRHKLDGRAGRMALGWHVAGDGSTRWHNGGTGGYHSLVAFDPARKIAVVVLANTASDRVDELGFAILRLLAGQKVEPLKARKIADVGPEILARYVGEYELAPDFVITVTLEDAKLMAQATGQEKFRIYAESESRFFYRAVDAQVTFVTNDRGTVEKLILHQNGRDAPGKKR